MRVIWHSVESNFRSPDGVYFNRKFVICHKSTQIFEIEKNDPRSIQFCE